MISRSERRSEREIIIMELNPASSLPHGAAAAAYGPPLVLMFDDMMKKPCSSLRFLASPRCSRSCIRPAPAPGSDVRGQALVVSTNKLISSKFFRETYTEQDQATKLFRGTFGAASSAPPVNIRFPFLGLILISPRGFPPSCPVPDPALTSAWEINKYRLLQPVPSPRTAPRAEMLLDGLMKRGGPVVADVGYNAVVSFLRCVQTGNGKHRAAHVSTTESSLEQRS